MFENCGQPSSVVWCRDLGNSERTRITTISKYDEDAGMDVRRDNELLYTIRNDVIGVYIAQASKNLFIPDLFFLLYPQLPPAKASLFNNILLVTCLAVYVMPMSPHAAYTNIGL